MWGRLVGVLGRGWWRYWEGVGGGIGKGLVEVLGRGWWGDWEGVGGVVAV